MKKTLIASALAAIYLTNITQAETVLYGSIRYDYQNFKDQFSNKNNKRVSNFNDAGSRIGLKGGEDLGNGVQVIYQLEWAFDAMEGGNTGNGFRNRKAYIGLVSDYGTFLIGRMDTPFSLTIVDKSVNDDFNSYGDLAAMRAVISQFDGGIYADKGEAKLTGRFGDYRSIGGGLNRTSNTISYLTPTWNGFSMQAAVTMDDDSKNIQNVYGNKKNIDLFSINAKYEHSSGFYAKVSYMQGYTIGDSVHTFDSSQAIRVLGVNRKSKAWGAHIGYRTEQIALSAAYTDAKTDSVNYKGNVISAPSNPIGNFRRTDKAKGWDIGAGYSFGDNYYSTVRIAYGEARYNSQDHVNYIDGGVTTSKHNSIKPKDKIWAVGFEQKLSERTRVWTEFQQIKQSGNHSRSKNSGTSVVRQSHGFDRKFSSFAIGLRHDF